MKILKTLLIVLLVLVGLAVIAMLILPKSMEVSRSVEIDAPASAAWEHVRSLRAQNAWSPWNELDTNMVHTYEGEDGTIGSFTTWKGNDSVGAGRQTIRAVDAQKMIVEIDLEFEEPWEAKSDVSLQVEALAENKSKVTWNFKQATPMPQNLFMTVMGMKGALAKDFEKGLGYLKKQVDEYMIAQANAPVFEVRREIRLPALYLIKKEMVTMADMKAYFEKNLGAFYGEAVKAGIADTGRAPAALYFTWDETGMKSEMSAAIPVTGGAEAPKGFEVMSTDSSMCLVIDFYGPYEKTAEAHEYMDKYLIENKLTLSGPVMEEYVTDPGKEADPKKWLTRIIYPVGNTVEQ